MSGPGFAVIDCETTGVFPGGRDRVIEIAVVNVDSRGNVGDQCSVRNPATTSASTISTPHQCSGSLRQQHCCSERTLISDEQ